MNADNDSDYEECTGFRKEENVSENKVRVPVPVCQDAKPVDTEINEEGASRYPDRERQTPKYLKDYIDPGEVDLVGYSVHYCCKVSEVVPENFQEAINSPEAPKWKAAMDDEIQSLKDNDTYELPSLPTDHSVVGGRWVYVMKEGLKGEEQYKARYVVKGYTQVKGVDYTDTFSPTVRMTSVRMLMQLSVQENFMVHCMDFKSAYLNSNIDCEIFVQQPEGYVKTGKDGEQLVWKLNKSLYGLKQSGRNWNNMLHTFFN